MAFLKRQQVEKLSPSEELQLRLLEMGINEQIIAEAKAKPGGPYLIRIPEGTPPRVLRAVSRQLREGHGVHLVSATQIRLD